MTFHSRVFHYVAIVLSFFLKTGTLDNVSEMVSGKNLLDSRSCLSEMVIHEVACGYSVLHFKGHDR